MATEEIITFDDLMGLLERNPDHLVRLRRQILDEEFRQLPAQMQLLMQTVQSHTVLLQALARSLEEQARTLQSHSRELYRHKNQLSRQIGDEAERRFQQRAPAYFSEMIRCLRVTDRFALADLIDDAVDAGQLTEGDQRSLLALDLAVHGRHRETRKPTRLAVEVSAGIGERDIMRAADRARLLEKLTGDTTVAVVGGYFISSAYRQLAEDKGVEVIIVTPPDSGEPEPEDEPDMAAIDTG